MLQVDQLGTGALGVWIQMRIGFPVYSGFELSMRLTCRMQPSLRIHLVQTPSMYGSNSTAIGCPPPAVVPANRQNCAEILYLGEAVKSELPCRVLCEIAMSQFKARHQNCRMEPKLDTCFVASPRTPVEGQSQSAWIIQKKPATHQ